MTVEGSRASELYREVILDHNRNPRNWGALELHSHQAEGHNPLCGDRYVVTAKLAADGTIDDIRIQGSGCAISKASASMLTDAVKGRMSADAQMLVEQFRQLVFGELDPENDPHHLGKLKVFSGIWEFPSRVKCATLPWYTLRSALNGDQKATTEIISQKKE